MAKGTPILSFGMGKYNLNLFLLEDSVLNDPNHAFNNNLYKYRAQKKNNTIIC